MSDSLADIETLALRCRAERAREYIGEAVLCYRAGAYRSAIVNTWIAVVFDLVDKIRELALAGDATAQTINAQYETYIAQINSGNDQGVKNALDFERNILTTCKDRLQFFNHQQLRDLERLREDRHQCAHPSFQKPGEPYRPSAEHARLHLRIAIEHVLSQPPVQGRSAIAELVTIVASEYFPQERFKATTVLQGTALAGASEALVRGFVDTLVFGFADPQSPLHHKAQVGCALAALLDIHRGQAEPRISRQLSKLVRDIGDDDIPAVAVLIANTPEALSLIDEPARIRIAEFVRTGPEAEVVKTLASLARHADFLPLVNARMLALDSERLAEAIATYGIRGEAKERALALLSEAGNWIRVNSLFTRLVMPLFELLTRTDVERIIRMSTETEADLPGSSGYNTFIDQVRRSGLIPEPELNAVLRTNRAGYLAPDPQVET
jgi:hypothetical protein